MTKINAGILQNAYPLSMERIKELEKEVLENGHTFAYLDENRELCFVMPHGITDLQDLAWHHAYVLSNESGTYTKKVYRNGGGAFTSTNTLTKETVDGAWVESGNGGSEEVILEERLYKFGTAEGGIYVTGPGVIDGISDFDLIADASYRVVWNGKEYTCVAQDFGDGNMLMGNMSIVGMGENTNEPFIIMMESGIPAIASFEAGSNTTAKVTWHTVGIYKVGSGNGGSDNTQEINVLSQKDYKFVMLDDSRYVSSVGLDDHITPFVLINGETYIVYWNGTSYTCVAEIVDSGICVGNKSITGIGANSGEPFFIGYTPADNTTPIIITGEVGAPDANENCCWHNVGVNRIVESSTGNSGEVILEEHEMTFVDQDGLFSNIITEPNHLVMGETYTVVWDGVNYECTAEVFDDFGSGITVLGNIHQLGGYADNGMPFFMLYAPAEVMDGIAMLYIVSIYDTAESVHTVGIYKTGESTATLILDCTFTTDAADPHASFLEDDSDTALLVGNKYRYTHFGMTFLSECFDYNGIPCIGNTLPANGVDNGQPCIIARDVNGLMFDGTPVWMCATMNYPDDFDGQIHIQIYDLGRPTTVFAEHTCMDFSYDSTYGAYSSGMGSIFQLNVGEKYRVVWDGATYECNGQDLSALVKGAVGVGNLAAFGGSGNNEPFVIGWSAQGVSFYAFDAASSHTVAIYRVLSDVPVGTALLEEKSYDNFVDFGESIGADPIGVYNREVNMASELAVGEVYKVVFDGKEYIVQAKVFNDSSAKPVYIGNLRTLYGSTEYLDTREPFLIYGENGNLSVGVMTKELGESHVVGVYKA